MATNGTISLYYDGKCVEIWRFRGKPHRNKIIEGFKKRIAKAKKEAYYQILFDVKDVKWWSVRVARFTLCGKYDKEYKTMQDAAKDMGTSTAQMHCIKKRNNKIYKNYQWKFFENI